MTRSPQYRRARGIAAVCALALGGALGGCQTIEYGPAGQKPAARYAYTESRVSDVRYVLTILGPPNADMAVMKSMWKRRAVELCGQNYTEALFRAERPTTTYGYYGGAPGAPILQGFLDCAAAPVPAVGDRQ